MPTKKKEKISEPFPAKKRIDRVLNFYIANTCLKSSDYFKVLPSCDKLNHYKYLMQEVEFDIDPALKSIVRGTYQEQIDYVKFEQEFRDMLSPEQMEKFDELRKKIVEWYGIQKEVLRFTIKTESPFRFNFDI